MVNNLGVRMNYSDDIVEEVRQQNDIVDVISEYVGLKRAGSSYKCCCPFHTEKTPSFTVSRDRQLYYCFGCGAGGNVYTFVMKYENLTFPEAIEHLAKRVGFSLPEKEMSEADKKRQSRRQLLYDVNRTAAAYFHWLLKNTERGKRAYDYFIQRGYTDETIQKFGLGYADQYRDDLYKYLKKKNFSDDIIRDAGLVKFNEKYGASDMFWNRAMVPIADINGKIIAFGGRVFGDGTPKYLNTNETDIFNKSRNLFAMNIARHSKRRGVILCEGYMDVIAMHQAGYDNAVASLGTAFTDGHATLIKRYTDEVYLAYDSDQAGRKAAMRAISILRNHDMSQRVIDLTPYKDPDEFIKNLGKDAYDERIQNAVTGRIFEIDQIVPNYDLSNPEEKTSFMKEAAILLSGIKDPTERNNYIDSVALKYRLNVDDLKKLVSNAGLAGLDQLRNNSNYDSRIQKSETAIRKAREKERDSSQDKQKYLLTMMVNQPKLFEKLDGIISEEDFDEGVIRTVATDIFGQYRENKTVNPARTMNAFDDLETQELVSSLFTKEFEFDTTPTIMEKALTELIISIKTEKIDKQLSSGEKVNALELARKKNELRKLKIHL